MTSEPHSISPQGSLHNNPHMADTPNVAAVVPAVPYGGLTWSDIPGHSLRVAPEEKRFKVSFNCEAEYFLYGRLYAARVGAHRRIVNPSYYPTVRALIGTVVHRDYLFFHEFPSPQVMECFPGFVAARFVIDDFGEWQVEYNGEPPDVVEDAYNTGENATDVLRSWMDENAKYQALAGV